METPRPTPQAQTEHRRILLIAIGIALVIVIGVSLYLQLKREPIPANTNVRRAMAVTPSEYSDFYGEITKLDNSTMTVTFDVTDQNGQTTTRSYAVAVDEETSLNRTVAGQSPTVITMSEFQVGNQVQVFGDGNLADKAAFTATHIVLISPTDS